METIDAIILGVIQGLTEFLPVSSSGHIELGKAVLGTDLGNKEENLLFTVVVHFATALSTIIVFRKDILKLLKGLFSFKWNDETQFTAKIVLSMIPAVIVGLLFEEQLEKLFEGQIILVGFMLIITGLLLFLAGRAKRTEKGVSWKDALIIGVSQAVAMLPGISRSGATISTSVLLGNDRAKAARFSFLMVVPLIFGKIAKDMLDVVKGDTVIDNVSMTPLIAGFLAAFIVGLLACTWMISLVRKAKLHYFSYYCFAIGIVAIVAGVMGS
ncbi:undecaprenyl-diphosphatase [Nonlabens dokdonensis]|jgi:undecaprenyl-diphosphatase|uniref:Undecaprenyl-diphosphatase n=2 Tax=Nonlabens dokdonensis TaxID=328515 RepID=L7WCV0_NONDD|nr:undecaprenyl-diphosphate phosphatase [Nonlabens dokdonensis]AGC76733.1 undecaprenol kinase, bacitracin resistance protein [Nonlabens dokdonensis DSW-6]PZX44380.1 undecaprenyl-diphosphatase [Nonlabens dokdonensis]